MTRRQVSHVLMAAGALIALVTTASPPRSASAWTLVEPYLLRGAVGAGCGAAVAALLRAALPRRAARPAEPRRQALPERVRHEVWRRDSGACVDCGSRARLEFDHIIPVSRGGSSTARNVELRCEPCNRRKGARI
jgi:HNH endonuclease